MNTQLPVHENNVAPQTARNHVQQERPADRTPTLSVTATHTNSPTTLPASPVSQSTLNTFPTICKTCKKIFYDQHYFNFDQKKHQAEKASREKTTNQTSASSSAVSVQLSALHASSKNTLVQQSTPWDHFPQYAIPGVEHPPTMAVDTSLLVDVRDLIWIKCVDATTQGVHGRDVLARTISDKVRLVPTVSFLALVGQKGIAERLRSIMRSHAYDGALHLQRTCRSVPMCSVWTNHLQLEDIVPNEDKRCLLEGGIECPLTCVRTFSSK
ncbi:hypothetical protein BDV95DRAFT_587690 [Massariosphaeria phaeospora]|uniref:Uncharacterized protein n=1 Tax=Massariosphaeria phaeospora TaxID=100035 RepID=A0A7C8M0H7_9PLEO|nr:hypothetical protein BDV95DRAFT_587690 [Massariosphaeria phaeospora]